MLRNTTSESCLTCGARTGGRLCNNPQSAMFKQYTGNTKTCSSWMHRVSTPPEWSKRRTTIVTKIV